MKNIEIKARCKDPEGHQNILMDLGAEFIGVDHQIDTYFDVRKGRLKLREGNIENALISYDRADQKEAKLSDFILYRSTNPALLKQMLEERMGIKVIVDKKRKIFYIDHVKFHLDEVKSLGSFVEIEVTDMNDERSLEDMHKTCQKYMDILGIEYEDLVSNSYSDLMANGSKNIMGKTP